MNRLKKSYSTCMSCGGKKMKSGGKWIQSAIKKPGSFTAQAKNAGMSVPAFRDKVLSNKEKFSSTTVKRANLAKTLAGMRKGADGMEMDMPREMDMPTVKPIDPLNMAAKSTLNQLEGSNLSPERQKVMKYQQMLKSKGYNIAADGAWGPQTQKAYESYIKTKTSTTASKSKLSPDLEAIHGTQNKPVRMQEISIKAKKPMSTASNLKQMPNTRMEPAYVTSAFNNLSKYKKNSPKQNSSKMSPYKGVSANEKLVLDRLAKYKAGKPLR
jgi:hypothetical protein